MKKLDTFIQGSLVKFCPPYHLFLSFNSNFLFVYGGKLIVIQTFEWLALMCICIPCLISTLGSLEMCCFTCSPYSPKIYFHAKSSRKHAGNSPEADSLRSNGRHWREWPIPGFYFKAYAVITSVKSSQEIKMSSYLYLLRVMLHIGRTFHRSRHYYPIIYRLTFCFC